MVREKRREETPVVNDANRHIFLALSRPRAGREVEFNTWYDTHHLSDVVTFAPGFVRGRRYLASARQAEGPAPPWVSLAIYDLQTEDVADMHLQVRANVKHFTPSNGVFEDDHEAWVYTPLDDPSAEDGGRPSGLSAEHARQILLAFSNDEKEITPQALGLVVEGRQFVLHPDQRLGVVAPWRRLTLFELAAPLDGNPSSSAGPETRALWLYDPVGREAGSA